MNIDGPDLRAVASLPEEEARRLLAVGLRTLPASHELRALACWSRRVWRPAVRVHALRALVRTPTALAHLSPRAQDMLFAVFRTVNPSNREVCASFFGVLLLAEDPWLIDSGGEGVDSDARRAAEAFERLYDVRHEYLGNLEPGNPDLLNRESDALRRHLGQTPPLVRVASTGSVLKAPRLDSKKSNEPSATSNASAMHGVVQVPTGKDEQSTGRGYTTLLEKRVAELGGEVDGLRKQLRDNEKRTKHLQTLFDFMAKVLLDELQISAAIPHIVSTKRPSNNPSAESSSSKLPTIETPSEREPGGSANASNDTENRVQQRIRLLERFREIVEASPWEPYGHTNGGGSNDSESAGAALRQGTNSSGSLPVMVFRNGTWVNR